MNRNWQFMLTVECSRGCMMFLLAIFWNSINKCFLTNLNEWLDYIDNWDGFKCFPSILIQGDKKWPLWPLKVCWRTSNSYLFLSSTSSNILVNHEKMSSIEKVKISFCSKKEWETKSGWNSSFSTQLRKSLLYLSKELLFSLKNFNWIDWERHTTTNIL